MKALILALLIDFSGASVSVIGQQTWPAVSKEKAERERDAIMGEIAKINRKFATQYASCVAHYREMARKKAIIHYLKKIGTPVSFQIYQEMLTTEQL